ncbi:MAG: cytidylate kinase-like family protein, partial [Planctomycetota bacterium]
EGPGRLAERLGRYLSISREEGAGGSQIAQLVGQELGWEVLDKSLLDRVAERYRLSRTALEQVDETRGSWVFDVLGTWMDRKIITQDKYVAHLGRVVLAAVRHGNVVLVGRGAQFLLPPEKGLAVRLIASGKYRIEEVMRREGLGQADAVRLIEETDQGRREFALRYFQKDIDDPHLYDLVINVERIGPAAAVQQIVAAIER